MHLLLPLLASVLFVCAMIFVKRLSVLGVGSITILFVSNECTALVFSALWFFGGTSQPVEMFWQPAVIAALFVLGLSFTFLAIRRGDVSVATPVFGVKVVFVTLLLTLISNERLPLSVWYGAVFATMGIALIQWTGRSQPQRVLMTIFLALSAALSYAMFDVLVQSWAPAWGVGRFLPLVFWMLGLSSLALIPWVDWLALGEKKVRRLMIPAALLIALQALCIIVTVAVFGDAARVNVVYALRGLWGVALAWAAARIWGGSESEVNAASWATRAVGAGLLTTAVVLVILAPK